MRKGFFGLAFFSFLISIFAGFAGCATTPMSAPKVEKVTVSGFPEGYQDWTNTASKVVLDKTSPFYGFQRVLVSPAALTAYKSDGKYPDGSELVLEFNEPLREGPEGEDMTKGSPNWIAVMRKDSSAAKTGGWVFAAYDEKTKTLKTDVDPVKGCYDCHAAMEKNNYVFSKYQ